MADAPRPYTFDRVVRGIIAAALVFAIFYLLRYLSDVLIPFAVAVILAYLLNPLVNLFEQRTGRRGLAVALTLGIVTAVGCTLLAVLIPLMVAQVNRFSRSMAKLRNDLAVAQAPKAQPDAAVPLPGGPAALPEGAEPADPGEVSKSTVGWVELVEGWEAYRENPDGLPRAERLRVLRERISGTIAGDLAEQVIAYTDTQAFTEFLAASARRLLSGGLSVLNFGVNALLVATALIVVLIYLVFLLIDYPAYVADGQSLLPPAYRGPILEFADEFQAVMSRYFRGQAVVAMCVGVLFAIGFSIMGLPMAVPFGLFVGLLNMVPYLSMVAIVPAIMLAAVRAIDAESSFVFSLALVLLVFAVVQIIQDALLTPRILGKATGLRPVAVLLGIFVWGKLLGFLGLIIAIPLTCLFIAYYRRIVLQQRSSVTT